MRKTLARSLSVFIVAIGVASCGGGSKSPGNPTAATPTSTTSAATTSAATTSAATTSAATTTVPTSSLAGAVTDAVSGAAVASATVSVQGRSATTGADGRYSITGLTEGQSAVTAQHQGHRNFSQNTSITGATTANIVMTPAAEAGGAGNWTGTWRNTTFGSVGNASLTMAVDTVAERFNGTFDLTGSVFGQGDPAPETFSGPYSTTVGASLTGTSSFYGAVTGTVSATGAIAGTMSNPTASISRVEFTGTATSSAIDITYTVRFTNGTTATGTVSLRK